MCRLRDGTRLKEARKDLVPVSPIHDMPAIQPVATFNLEALLSTDEVSHRARQSFHFSHRLSMDSHLRSGLAFFTLETLILGLAA
ncbi:MAG: hypothetical protein ABL974_20620 [Prosthecobacter sp.]